MGENKIRIRKRVFLGEIRFEDYLQKEVEKLMQTIINNNKK